MRNLALVTALLIGNAVWPCVVRADFTFDDFDPAAGLNLVGSATTIGGILRLTPAAQNQIGTVWSATPQSLSGGFATNFVFQFSSPGGITDLNGKNGADGIAFNVASTSNANPLFTTPATFSVKIDTFNNFPFDTDPSGNFVAVYYLGNQVATQDLDAFGIDLSDGQTHATRIAYAGSVVKLFVDSTLVLSASAIDLGAIPSPTYVGLTGYTGLAYQNQDVLSWSVTSVPEPPSVLILGAGLLCLVKYRRRPSCVA